jgi:hypothetical protein
MMADGKTLQIPQALASTQDSQHQHQGQLLGRDAHPPSPSDRKAGLAAVDASLSHPAGEAAIWKAESLGHGVTEEDFLQAQDNGL